MFIETELLVISVETLRLISTEEFQKYDVGKAFMILQVKICAILKTANYHDLKRACIAQMRNPDGVRLSPTFIEKIKATKSVDSLLDLLVFSCYWSWIDIRLMEAMVLASQNSLASTLLDNYKVAIFSRRLEDVLLSSESKAKCFRFIEKRIRKDYSEITVADLLEVRPDYEELIMEITHIDI